MLLDHDGIKRSSVTTEGGSCFHPQPTEEAPGFRQMEDNPWKKSQNDPEFPVICLAL
jgi:hypothetical protein